MRTEQRFCTAVAIIPATNNLEPNENRDLNDFIENTFLGYHFETINNKVEFTKDLIKFIPTSDQQPKPSCTMKTATTALTIIETLLIKLWVLKSIDINNFDLGTKAIELITTTKNKMRDKSISSGCW